jgi:hypothetical protein
LKYDAPADDAGEEGVMGVVGDELRNDDADDDCVLIVVVASIFRSVVCRSLFFGCTVG